MKVSCVIPHVPISKEFDEMLDECTRSLMGQKHDELILVINDGIGYGKSFNRGFRYAKGDYIIGISNDTQLIDGNLTDMCDPEAVTYSSDAQWGCFFCLPRWVLDKIGGFDTRFGMAYYEDDNYLSRLKRAGIPCKRVPTVKVFHLGGVTVRGLGHNDGELQAKNKLVFEQIEKEYDEGASLYVSL